MPASKPSFLERRYLSQDGLSLYYREYGDRYSRLPVVICLPGLTRNSKDFHGIAKWFAFKGYRVLCPDLRGRGQSDYDPNPENYDPKVYIGDIWHLMTATGAHRVILLGTSLGGIMATGLNILAASAIAGIIINDVGPDLSKDGINNIIRYVSNTVEFPDWQTTGRHLQKTFPDLPAATDEDWIKMAKGTYKQCEDGKIRFDWDPNIALPLQNNKQQQPDLWPFYRSLRKTPCLCLRGEKSDVLSLETFNKMKVEIPNMDCVTVPGVGHAPSLAEPESHAAITALLEKIN